MWRFILLLFFIPVWTLAQQSVALIPAPAACVVNEGVCYLNRIATVYAEDVFVQEIYFLQTELLRHKQLVINTTSRAEDANILFLKSDTPCPSSYKLTVENKQVVVTASSAQGAFYGAITLLQLVNSATTINHRLFIPCVEITDAPKFEWRGLMLDESRHFFGKEKVKEILDWMAYYKLNKFHWHLTDEPAWRLEISQYPRLGLVGGIGSYTNPLSPAQYYSHQDVREVVEYARLRHIEVIPEIDMPGHASAANRAYPEFNGGGSAKHPDFTFHPGKEGTYQYLTNILKETNVLFPSQMIHIGGDEVSFGNQMWHEDKSVKQLMAREKLRDLKDVENYFMRRMADSLMALNSQVLVWDEMADAGLPRDKSIIFWWRHDRVQQLKKALDNGHRTVICPRLPFYFDFVQDETHRYGRRWSDKRFNSLKDVYQFSLDSLGLTAHQHSLVLGFQANIWTETINNEQRLDYMMFPRIAALAESVWQGGSSKGFDHFLRRLTPHFELYRKYGICFFNPLNPSEISEPALIK